MRRFALPTTIIAMTIALGASLSGCSTPTTAPEPEEQTAEDACFQLQPALEEAGNDVNAATAILLDDAEGASLAVTQGSVELSDAARTLDNGEVRELAEQISDAMARYGQAVTVYGDDASESNGGAVLEVSDELDSHFSRVDELCE